MSYDDQNDGFGSSRNREDRRGWGWSNRQDGDSWGWFSSRDRQDGERRGWLNSHDRQDRGGYTRSRGWFGSRRGL